MVEMKSVPTLPRIFNSWRLNHSWVAIKEWGFLMDRNGVRLKKGRDEVSISEDTEEERR